MPTFSRANYRTRGSAVSSKRVSAIPSKRVSARSSIKSRFNSKRAETEREKVNREYTEQVIFGYKNLDLLEKMRNNTVYVYIRAHSALPYDTRKEDNFDIYEIPSDMNLIKITAAINGERNTGYYEYQDKKDLINNSIVKYNENNENKSAELNPLESAELDLLESTELNPLEPAELDLLESAEFLQAELRNYELNKKIPNAENRNILSNNNKILNKIIVPLSELEKEKRQQEKKEQDKIAKGEKGIKDTYRAVQISFYDKTEHKLLETPIDIHLEIYKLFRELPQRRMIGYENAIKIADIIKFLHEYLKVKNVVLLDFTCSSWVEPSKKTSHENENENENEYNAKKNINKNKKKLKNFHEYFNDYLNTNNLHGGKTKSKRSKRTKKTKRTKRTNKTRTNRTKKAQ